MSPEERHEMRRVQVEQYLASGMSLHGWCRLNRVPSSTLYYWVDYFRTHEPELFNDPSRKEWIELSRDSIKAKSTLAVVDSLTSSTPVQQDSTDLSYDNADANTSPIMVHFAHASIAIPPHTQKADIQNVVEVIANL